MARLTSTIRAIVYLVAPSLFVAPLTEDHQNTEVLIN